MKKTYDLVVAFVILVGIPVSGKLVTLALEFISQF